MTIPTEDQALNRWDTVSQDLREALSSEPNSEFLWKTCIEENIPEEKIYDVSRIAGYVLLGFLHPEDVADELIHIINIDTQTAKSIQGALNNRIFIPLRPSIDKAYSPLSKSEIRAASGLKTSQNISSSFPESPKPAILSDIGWSKQPQTTPTAPAAITKTATPPPAPTPTPTSVPVPKPIAPAPAPEPAPVMLHQDTAFKPAEKNAGFTLTKPQSGAEMSFGKSPAQTPIRPAVLEFGSSTGGANKPAPKPSVPEFKSAPITAPTASGGSRNISQITAPAASPVPPPSPVSAVPKPPAPPTPPKPPVIKNFTGGSIPTPPPAPRPPQASASPQMPIPQPPQPPKPPASPFASIPKPPAAPTPPQNNKAIVKDFLS